MSSIRFADSPTLTDFRTFISRARAVDDGAIRLQLSGPVLAAWICSMRPRLLGEGTPTILGLRTMAIEESGGADAQLDATVSLASVSDRLARLSDVEVELPIPAVTVNESWAALSAPRSGWTEETEIAGAELIAVAKEGVREIAQIIPVNPGALIVNNARASVWGRPLAAHPELPGGAAFAGFALGFWTPEAQVKLFRSGRWLRLSSTAGHILIRPAAAL